LYEKQLSSDFFAGQSLKVAYSFAGMYMPPLGLLCAGLVIKAFAMWLKMQEDPTKKESAGKEVTEEVKSKLSSHVEKVCYCKISVIPIYHLHTHL
jgi:hypothetical protein